MKYYLIYSLLYFSSLALIFAPSEKSCNKPFHSIIAMTVCSLLALFLWNVTLPGSDYIDFTKAYYDSGELILANPSALYQGRQPEFVNIPIVAFLFTPFSLLGKEHAVALLEIATIATIFITCMILLKAAGQNLRTLLLIVWLFAVSGPLFYSIRLGNLTHFLLPLIALSMLTDKQFLAGVMTACCGIIKPPLMLWGVFYIARKRWASAVGFWCTVAFVMICSVLISGIDLHFKWYMEIVQGYSGKIMGAYNSQSVSGFLSHLLSWNNLYSWEGLVPGWKIRLAKFAIVGFILGFTGLILWRSGVPSTKREYFIEFTIILCLSILIAPISWIHYYSLLIVPFAILFSPLQHGNCYLPQHSATLKGILAAAIFLISLPVVHTLPDVVAPEIPAVSYLVKHVLVSNYFFGGVLLIAFLLYLRRNLSSDIKDVNEERTC